MQSVYGLLAQGNGRVSYMFPTFRRENQGIRGDVPMPYLISVLESFLASQHPVKTGLQLLVMSGVVGKKHDHQKAQVWASSTGIT